MESLDPDTVALLSRRAFDVAASTRGVKVFLNGKRLPVKSFKDYVDLCLKVYVSLKLFYLFFTHRCCYREETMKTAIK